MSSSHTHTHTHTDRHTWRNTWIRKREQEVGAGTKRGRKSWTFILWIDSSFVTSYITYKL